MSKLYKDPFIGEMNLLKVGETSMHLMGESVVHTIYTDEFNGHYYICNCPSIDVIIPRRVIDKIVQIENERLPNGK